MTNITLVEFYSLFFLTRDSSKVFLIFFFCADFEFYNNNNNIEIYSVIYVLIKRFSNRCIFFLK